MSLVVNLVELQARFPELKVESMVLTSIPPRYETTVSSNGRIILKLQNQTSIEHNYKEIVNYILEYGVKTLIEQSKQP